jgi:peptidoglycan lytic transglycosylase B
VKVSNPWRTAIITHRLHYWLIVATLFGSLLLHPGWCEGGAADQPQRIDAAGADNQLIDLSSERYRQFFRELEEQQHFTAEELGRLFQGVRVDQLVLELMDKPGEAKPYYRYRPLFITPSAIAMGKQSLEEYRPLFDRIEAEFGVDREIVVAIWGIESRFGFNQGGFNLFRTLNTLFDRYPRRSAFFRNELIQFLLLCRDNGIDPLTVFGSYAGAFGQAQFMPSSFREYAVDFDGDKHCDLIGSRDDVFASIANYLRSFGWTLHAPVYAELGNRLGAGVPVDARNPGQKVLLDWRLLADLQQRALPRPPLNGKLSIVGLEQSPESGGGRRYIACYPNFRALTAYNRSEKYAMVISELAEAFKN